MNIKIKDLFFVIFIHNSDHTILFVIHKLEGSLYYQINKLHEPAEESIQKFTTNVSWWSDVNEKSHDHVIHFKCLGPSSESFLFTKTLSCKESLTTLKRDSRGTI